MRVLATGRAEYIGSHVLVEFCPIVDSVLLNKYSSSQAIYNRIRDIRHHDRNLCDKQDLDEIFASETFDTVLHLARYKSSNDSVQQPIDYDNNHRSSLDLMSACLKHMVGAIVFNSPATEFGPPQVGRTRRRASFGLAVRGQDSWLLAEDAPSTLTPQISDQADAVAIGPSGPRKSKYDFPPYAIALTCRSKITGSREHHMPVPCGNENPSSGKNMPSFSG